MSPLGPGVTGNDPYEGAQFAATYTSLGGGGIFQDVPATINVGDTFCGSARVATQGGAAVPPARWWCGLSVVVATKLLQGLRQPFRRQRLVTGADRCHPDADHRRRRLIDNRESSGARDPLVRQKNQPWRGYRRTARWTPPTGRVAFRPMGRAASVAAPMAEPAAGTGEMASASHAGRC